MLVTPVIPALGEADGKMKDLKFKIRLGNSVRPSLKIKKEKAGDVAEQRVQYQTQKIDRLIDR